MTLVTYYYYIKETFHTNMELLSYMTILNEIELFVLRHASQLQRHTVDVTYLETHETQSDVAVLRVTDSHTLLTTPDTTKRLR